MNEEYNLGLIMASAAVIAISLLFKKGRKEHVGFQGFEDKWAKFRRFSERVEISIGRWAIL